MKQSIVKFLEFKGKNIAFLSKNGVNHIAVKPICEALGIDYIRAFKNLKDDPVFGPSLSKQTILIPGDTQSRKFVCITEEFVYGWILSLRSLAEGLLEYKLECHHVLFEYFRGSIPNRKEVLRESASTRMQRLKLESELRGIDKFVEYEKVKAKEARLGKTLKSMDKDIIDEVLDLFSSSGVEIDN